MFKLTLKLLTLTLLLTVGLLFVSGNHASALSDNCGSNGYNDWGYRNGAGSLPNAMSSLMLRAVDTSNNNAPLNTNYTINSMDPNSSNPDFQKRIFQWIPGTGPANRQATNTFSTGENLRGTAAGEPTSCNGWSVLGPGISYTSGGQQYNYAGNGYVLDCGDASHEFNINFWISHVDNPGGAPGTWKLYDTTGGSRRLISDDVNSDNGAQTFNESNGGNISLRLEWNPAPTQPPPSAAGACQSLSISETAGSTLTRTYVSVTGVTVGRVHYKEGSNEKWWNSQNGPGNLNQTDINTYVGPGSGHDPPDNPNVSGSPAWDGEKNMTVTKDWSYQPSANSITVSYHTDTWDSATSSWNNGSTQYLQRNGDNSTSWTTTPTSLPCFTASCSISYVDGDGPGGIVLANGRMHIHGFYYNTSPGPDYLPIWSPTLSASGSQNGGNNHGYTLWNSPPPAYTGWPYDFDIYMTAPNNVTQDNFSLTPIYFGNDGIGPACSSGGVIPSGGQPIYQQFSATASPYSHLSPTIENPTGDNYGATINQQWVNPPAGLPAHDINNKVTASFYQRKASGAQTTPCSPSSYSHDTYVAPSSASGGDRVWDNNCTIAPGSFAAGDEFCSAVSAQYSGGYVGPDNNVIDGTGPYTPNPDCPRVVNEPYFKVNHSDISAGGDFDQCTTHGGTLAGYADISDPASATRGSTTQLSALALLKITGVASAKTSADITGSPTKLSFANTGVQVDSSGNESPVLGGQFGGCRTLTNETAPASAQRLAGGSTGAVPVGGSGAYKHTGNLTISGGTLGANQNVSMFVTGDVYISSDITYGNSWQAGTAPSFIVHATGNIYIAPGVKQLAGVYIAQEKVKADGTPDTATGKIYTCADSTGFAPMSAANLYNGCKNQLVVYGSFVADQINLMRSFGSLRDEIPNPEIPSTGGITGWEWSCGGGDCNPHLSEHWNCTYTNEPGDPNGGPRKEGQNYTWSDNQVCVPITLGVDGSHHALSVAWTSWGSDSNNSSTNPGNYNKPSSGLASLDYLKTHGYPACTQWTPKASDGTIDDSSWNDNYLCLGRDIGLTFGTNPNLTGQSCLRVYEPADPLDNWANGYYLCAPVSSDTPPTAKGPPFTDCSNRGVEIDTNSCAGEIFEYSPALYLSNGGGTTQPPSGGSLQLQSINSLPPVL